MSDGWMDRQSSGGDRRNSELLRKVQLAILEQEKTRQTTRHGEGMGKMTSTFQYAVTIEDVSFSFFFPSSFLNGGVDHSDGFPLSRKKRREW